MRIWLDPDKLANLNMTPDDVVAALRQQNIQVAAGVIGQPPMATGNPLQLNISALGRLSEEQQFEDIVVKTGDQGQIVRLRDVARVELGGLDYGVNNYASTTPAVAMPITQLPGSNALETARNIRSTMAGAFEILSGRTRVRHHLRSHHLYFRIDHGGGAYHLRSHPPGRAGGDGFSPDLARLDHSTRRHSDITYRCVCLHGGAGLFPEQSFALRSRAGHRHRGR